MGIGPDPTLALVEDFEEAHNYGNLPWQGLPAEWQFPVFLCEELQSSSVLPVFFTRAGMVPLNEPTAIHRMRTVAITRFPPRVAQLTKLHHPTRSDLSVGCAGEEGPPSEGDDRDGPAYTRHAHAEAEQ